MEYGEDITELFNVLMTLEMQLVEQLEVRPGPWGTEVARSCPARPICKDTVIQLQNRTRAGTFPGTPLLETSSATQHGRLKLSLLISPVFAFNIFQPFRV